MHTVRERFEQARTNRAEIDSAIAVVEEFLASHPQNPVALGYLGSLQGMKADTAVLPWVKLRQVNLAVRLLNEAYQRRFEKEPSADEIYPAELEILLLRGIAFASFPAFLGRGDAARNDLGQAKRHPAFPGIPSRYRALTYAHLAALCARAEERGEALRFLTRARSADLATAEQIYNGEQMLGAARSEQKSGPDK
ncbi:MAG: hypothetical protein AB7O79_11320 [Xanthobacteraceae bacterium]